MRINRLKTVDSSACVFTESVCTNYVRSITQKGLTKSIFDSTILSCFDTCRFKLMLITVVYIFAECFYFTFSVVSDSFKLHAVFGLLFL